jgi:hypothetical protein
MDSKVAIAVAFIALVGTIAVAVFGYFATRRQADAHMVQIAVSILASEPAPHIKPAREWAIALIDEYSDVDLTEAQKATLLNYRLEIAGIASGVGRASSGTVTLDPP